MCIIKVAQKLYIFNIFNINLVKYIFMQKKIFLINKKIVKYFEYQSLIII